MFPEPIKDPLPCVVTPYLSAPGFAQFSCELRILDKDFHIFSKHMPITEWDKEAVAAIIDCLGDAPSECPDGG